MLKSILENSHKLIKANRRFTLTDNHFENYFSSDTFIDEITNESYEYCGESDEDEINTTLLTYSFKIILSETEGNFLFYTLYTCT